MKTTSRSPSRGDETVTTNADVETLRCIAYTKNATCDSNPRTHPTRSPRTP